MVRALKCYLPECYLSERCDCVSMTHVSLTRLNVTFLVTSRDFCGREHEHVLPLLLCLKHISID